MTKKATDLAEYLIFNFLLDAKCKSSDDFEAALDTLLIKTKESQVKLLSSRQLNLDV